MPSDRRFTFAVLAVAALSVSACTGSDSSPSALAVAPAALTSLQISPNAADGVLASVGAAVPFTATGSFDDGSTADLTSAVTWSSSNPDVAAFSGGAGVASAIAVGSTDVVASASGLQASVKLTVVPSALVLLEISPLDPTILVGTSLQLDATGTLADESTVAMTGNVLWSSSDEAVATVSATGLVAALAVGSTTITATDPVTGMSDTIQFNVTDVPAALAYIRMSRGSVIGGSDTEVSGTVVLTSYAIDPVVVTLWTDDPEIAVQDSVTVPAGSQSATFWVTHSAVAHRTRTVIYGTDGTYTKRARLNLRVDRRN